ncbi:hypothetical protein IWW37_003468 [Coemansia sp. RSA 2050]|nr:hypothetical protein IWW37_003468 [Coemansia sp. RSA 2050]KAJ2735150.1 hypothetical protein IW152_001779 [Coemansia sp. BCRC 34962]
MNCNTPPPTHHSVIELASAENIGFVVLSTLPSAKKLLNGEITEVLHFEGKYKNQENESGDAVALAFPGDVNRKLPYADVSRDLGPYVKFTIDNRERSKGKVFPVPSGYYSTTNIAIALTKVTGLRAVAAELPTDAYGDKYPQGMFELIKTHEIFVDSPDYLDTNKSIPFEFTTP